jgi:hypothetical protein
MAHVVIRWLGRALAAVAVLTAAPLQAAPPQPAYVTGSPVTGALAKASGPQSVTTGDLSGDCTTSGGLATTCARGSSATFGMVKVDGTTITAAGGVISAAGGSGTVTVSGTPTTGNCAKFAGSTVITDAGAACGSGGGGGTTNNYYGGGPLVGARAYNIGTQSISAATVTVATFNTNDFDTSSLHSTSSNTSRMVAPSTGKYRIDYTVKWSGGSPINWLRKNAAGAGTDADNITGSTVNGSGATTLVNTVYVQLNAGDYVELFSYNTSGVTIGAASGSNAQGNYTTLAMALVPDATTTVNPQPGLPVICEVVTSGSAASVTVGGGSGSCPTIPSTYRDLEVVVSGRSNSGSSAAVNLLMQLNGDTGSNYDYEYTQANGTTTSSGQSIATTNLSVGLLSGNTAAAGLSGGDRIRIHDYASTTFYKTTSSQGGGDGGTGVFYNGTYAGNWKNTSAVTTLTVWPSSGGFMDGSKVTVYGVGGSPTATLPVVPPQGRLTLTSNTPVMTADATAATTIYYAPYVGTLLPVGNVMYRFSQLSYALNTTAHASGSLYDVFAYNNAGAINLCTGPAWTNSTTRSAAIQQDAVNGIWENAASLTCNLTGSSTTTTIAAGQATYLGTMYATANGQTGMAMRPTGASGGTANVLGLYNAYNRVRASAMERDTAGSYTYASATWRALDNNNNNRVTFIDGLGQSNIETSVEIFSSGGAGLIGMNLDSISATPDVASTIASFANASTLNEWSPQIGLHYIQGMEASGSGTSTYYPTTSGRQTHHMRVSLEM